MTLKRLPGVALILTMVAWTAAGVSVTKTAWAKHPYPTPGLETRSWQITFTWHRPMRLMMFVGAGAKRRLKTFWFLRYTVANNTHRNLFFIPRIELVADTGKIIRPVITVSPKMLKKIRTATGDPFIINPALIAGRLLQGADNARESVAVFTGIPAAARAFRIFIGGLSGETAVQKNPLTHKPVVLHKTLVLHYWIPGKAIRIRPRSRLLSKKWVMR